MKTLDIEAKFYMYFFKLIEEKNQEYTIDECHHNIVYVFDDYKSFEAYFINNSVEPVNLKKMYDICVMKKTKKGTIIALKGLCDKAITLLSKPYIKEKIKNSDETLLEPKQHPPVSYEEFKKLDYSEQQKIISSVKLTSNKENQNDSSNQYEKLIMLSKNYSKKEREKIKEKEAKILKK